ncbi:ribonuclease BN/unknown domain fusion protein [mine drainage metagenome]|uniref:Uncharacterized protein n=1 Tax=mine drainage metagenome TaxID=410659 RepID=A0A1J5T073_9ZZZZ
MADKARPAALSSSFWRQEIWRHEHLGDRSPRGFLYALLRGVLITGRVFRETKAMIRAAALSYSSMLALGPLVAIVMIFAGFVLNKKDPATAVNGIHKVIEFVAPSVAEFEKVSKADASAKTAAALNRHPAIVELINGFVKGSRSGAAGTLGAISLVFIVLMLFTSVENAFNEIWGVRRGRSWLVRIVVYWTLVTFGAIVFFLSLTALGAGAFVSIFLGKLPYGTDLLHFVRWALPLCSVAFVIFVLTLFYRYVPNTEVRWHAALTGSAVVTTLIFANNLFAFFYFRQVLQSRSLYGSIGIVPVLMLGLYVFWIFVLIGGQVSYAVQNARLLSGQAGWHRLSNHLRERLALSVFLAICRRFKDSQEPYTATEIADRLHAPTQIVNECLNRLADLHLVAAVQSEAEDASSERRYLPTRSLERLTLAQFGELDSRLGDDDKALGAIEQDPLLGRLDAELSSCMEAGFLSRPLDELLDEIPWHPISRCQGDQPVG